MAAYPLEKEISLGFLQGNSRNGPHFLRHARRELDVELLDGEFAGDEAKKMEISNTLKILVLHEIKDFECWIQPSQFHRKKLWRSKPIIAPDSLQANERSR